MVEQKKGSVIFSLQFIEQVEEVTKASCQKVEFIQLLTETLGKIIRYRTNGVELGNCEGRQSMEIVNEIYLHNMIQTPEKNNRRSPYVAASKTKGASFFPKIQRAECPENSKPVAKYLGKRNYHESIFKIKGDIPARIKLPTHLPDVDDEKVMQSRHYKQLEAQMEQAQAKFKHQLEQIDARKEAINEKLGTGKQDSYQLKYSLWEIRNQIIELENALREEEQEQDRLLYELGYEEQAETPEQGSEQAQDADFNLARPNS